MKLTEQTYTIDGHSVTVKPEGEPYQVGEFRMSQYWRVYTPGGKKIGLISDNPRHGDYSVYMCGDFFATLDDAVAYVVRKHYMKGQ